MKYKAVVITLIITAILGCFCALPVLGNKLSDAARSREQASTKKETALKKISECSGYASTNNAYVNYAGLTDCGGRLAVNAPLRIVSLSDIYYKYCNYGFGVSVYGCADSVTREVYVCKPGTTVHDRKIINRWRARIFSYSCDNVSNTIRHELLHLVYFDLTSEEQSRVTSALFSYRNEYADELSQYDSSQRDDELFVRVGADGRSVSNIELVELYSKVSRAYVSQKQNYYRGVADNASRDYKKHNQTYNGFLVLLVTAVAAISFEAILLVVAVVVMQKDREAGSKK